MKLYNIIMENVNCIVRKNNKKFNLDTGENISMNIIKID